MPGEAKNDSPIFNDPTKDLTYKGFKYNQVVLANAFEYPLVGTDADPDAEGAHFKASLTTKKVWIKCNMLKVGDRIVGFRLRGRVTSGGNVVTVDADFQKVPVAGTPADPTGDGSNDLTQVSKTAAYTFGATENVTFTTPYVVVVNETYNIEVLVTTGAAATAKIHGAELLIDRK